MSITKIVYLEIRQKNLLRISAKKIREDIRMKNEINKLQKIQTIRIICQLLHVRPCCYLC